MQIIAHRGMSGLELENTKSSLTRAVKMRIPAIEVDVRRTKDKQLVLCHDSDMERISGKSLKINDHTLRELQSVELLDGSSLITLDEACRIVSGKSQLIIEMKESGSAREVVGIIKKHPKLEVSVASYKVSELILLRELAPDIELYVLSLTKALDGIHMARMFKLSGVGINFWLLNPITYLWAKQRGLKIYVFTVNNKLLAKLISWLYPDVSICSDNPQWFIGTTT